MRIHITPNLISKYSKFAAILFLVSACATKPYNKNEDCDCSNIQNQVETVKTKTFPVLVKSSFDALRGWPEANHQALLNDFINQCNNPDHLVSLRSRSKEVLIDFCLKTNEVMQQNPSLPMQIWLENEMNVWQLQQKDGSNAGLLTGYYEPELVGSRYPSKKYQYPLFSEPSDLITVDLTSLYPELKGKRLRGRLQGQKLVPFFDRGSWEKVGSNREKPLAWVDDQLDAFLLQVQGSGRVRLENGEVIRLSYANQNGHPYTSIGRTLVKWGELSTEQATIPGIRAWLDKNPERVNELLNSNSSIVFFTENTVIKPEQGPVGALGIPLTPKRSIAIDRSKIPYGSLLWLDSSNPQTNEPLHQGVLAQDTGGAIVGRVRADFFWGTGTQAGQLAGITRQPLKLWLFWPKNALPPVIQD